MGFYSRTPFVQTLKSVLLFVGGLFLATLCAVTSAAQTDGGLDSNPDDPGTGGRNRIHGRLYLPSGRKFDRRLRVRLSSVRGGETSTMTDDNGSFTFRRLAGGTYHLTVEAGKEFEPAVETVDLIESPFRSQTSQQGQVITVQIQLQLKRAETNRPAVVSAAMLGVPVPARELYEKALGAAQGGDHKKAVEHLQSALALHPEFPLALNELGVQHQLLGQLDKAAAAFRDATKLAPDVFVLRFNYGVVLVRLKKFVEGEAELRKASEKDDKSAAARLYLGRALIGLGRDREAEQELQTAIKLGGDQLSVAHRYLGAIYNERGDRDRAVAALETYLRLEPAAKDAAQIRQIIEDLRARGAKK
ncbi:MAG: tetratricopeptide repeat protein [Pyrinomonadaceae bacterium]